MPSDQVHKERRSRLPSINKLLLADARLINKREQIGRRGAAREDRIALISDIIRQHPDQATRLGDHITKIGGSLRITWNRVHLAIMFGRSRAHRNPRGPVTRKTAQHAFVCTDGHLVHEADHVDGNITRLPDIEGELGGNRRNRNLIGLAREPSGAPADNAVVDHFQERRRNRNLDGGDICRGDTLVHDLAQPWSAAQHTTV